MRCYRKILHFSYKDHVTNEEVFAKIQQAIGPHEDLAIIKRRKLQWYGHGSHSSYLAKTILQGTVKGGRRQGRQRKRWGDNIREWTGVESTKSQRAVENREKWRKLVVKSSVVLQRPSGLRDRWWWEKQAHLCPCKVPADRLEPWYKMSKKNLKLLRSTSDGLKGSGSKWQPRWTNRFSMLLRGLLQR